MRDKPFIPLLKGVLLGLVVATATSAGATDAKLVPESLLLPRLAYSKSAPGVEDTWRVLRITPAGRKQYLALLEHEAYRFGRWPDVEQMRKERGKAGVVTTGRPEKLTDQLVLAILNDRGKILYKTEGGSEAAVKGNFFAAWYSVPLVMDATDTCPYAIVNTGSGTLLCYDYQLAFKAKHEIPLHDIRYPRVTFDGEGYTLWLFGTRYREKPKVKESADVFNLPAEPVETYGIRYNLRQGAWEPLPVDGNALLADLERIARNEEGERLRIQPASVSITPFRDLDADEGFSVLIEAVASERFADRALFSGTRVFFRSRMSSHGMGKIEQLPLWIVQEDRADATLDEQTGVLRFPRLMRFKDLQPFGLGANDLALVLHSMFKAPKPDGSYGRRGARIQLMLLFSGTNEPPRILDLGASTLRKLASRSLSTDDIDVLPVELVSRVGTSEFAFLTLCDDVHEHGKRRPCTAIMSLTY